MELSPEIRANFSLLTGKNAADTALIGHQHAAFFLIPDSQGKPSRLICWRKEPFSDQEQTALLAAAEARGVQMTGGFSFVFDLKHESMLVDGYHRAMWSVPEPRRDRRRTRYFLELNRKFGQPQASADILPSSGSQET